MSHALQAALYCLEDEEGPLLRYLANARDLLGRPLYDPQTALRLARQRNKLHACVELLCDLNLYEVRQPTHGQAACMLACMLAFGILVTATCCMQWPSIMLHRAAVLHIVSLPNLNRRECCVAIPSCRTV